MNFKEGANGWGSEFVGGLGLMYHQTYATGCRRNLSISVFVLSNNSATVCRQIASPVKAYLAPFPCQFVFQRIKNESIDPLPDI